MGQRSPGVKQPRDLRRLMRVINLLATKQRAQITERHLQE
jgi:hypothetical protein